MFGIKSSFRYISRRPAKSLLVVVISLILALFVSVYLFNIETSRQQLAHLPDAIPVSANVCNLTGSQIVGLQINEPRLLSTRDSGYVKDMRYSAKLAANFADTPNEVDKYKDIQISAVNNIQAVSNIEDKKMSFIDGVDESFLLDEEALCLASDAFLMQYGLKVGDTMELAMYTYVYNSDSGAFSFQPLLPCSLRIVGSISSETYSAMDSALICPVGWARVLHVKAGADMHYDFAAFTVANPLELNAFKAAMDELGWMTVIATAKDMPHGISLRVRDEAFIVTAENLQSNLAGLYTFLPVVFAVIVMVGYAVSYLLMQSRRRDIVVMRSLGVSRPACVTVMTLELASLAFLGTLAGIAAFGLAAGFNDTGALAASLLFFGGFFIGVLGAAVQISKHNIVSGLNKTEE